MHDGNIKSDVSPLEVEAFSSKIMDTLNNAFLSLSLSTGYRTGLFETMARLPAATSCEIADAAGLHERYVREWLGAMVTGGIVRYRAGDKKYHLPAEHAQVLTSAAGLNNMARFAQLIPQLGGVAPQIESSFREGGGVPYSAYPEFMQLWSEVNGERLDATLTQQVLPLMPDVVQALERGISVLDVGCGDGHVLRLMASAYPNSDFTGYDLVDESIQLAVDKAKAQGLGNICFKKCDILAINTRKKYDLVTAFDSVHDLAEPANVLNAINTILADQGTFLMVDLAASSNLEDNINHPLGSWLYTSSCMHCVTVSMQQGGEGLGAMWGEQKAMAMLADAGFNQVSVKKINDDPFNNYYIARRSER